MKLRPHHPVGEPKSPAVIHEFTYRAGRVTESVAQPMPLARGRPVRGLIYVVLDVEGAGPASDRLRQTFVQFFQTSATRSITSTLQHAVQHLNEEMLADNLRSVRNEQLHAALACAVIRDEDVYIALAGPAVCYALGASGCERFGRVEAQRGDRSVPLMGQVEEIGVGLYHRPLEDLAELILSSSGIADLDGDAFDKTLDQLDGSVARHIRRLAAQHRGKRRFTAAVLSFGDVVDDRSQPPPINPDPPPLVRSLGHENGHRRAGIPRPLDGPTLRVPVDPTDDPPPDIRQRPRPIDTRLQPDPSSGPAEVAPDRSPPIEGRLSRLRLRLIALARRHQPSPDLAWGGPEPAPARRRPRRRPIPGRSDRQARRIADWESTDEASALGPPPMLPAPSLVGAPWRGVRPAVRPTTIRLPPEALRMGVIALALVALFYAGYLVIQLPLRIYRESTDAASAIAKLSQAEQRERDALAATDPMTRRRLLDEASQLATQAAIERPESAAVATATARIRTEYQTAIGAVRLSAPTKVLDLPSIADELVLVTPNLFVLDRTNSLVYSYLLNVDGTSVHPTANPVLVRKGDHVGPATVGALSHLAWVPGGAGRKADNLVILDASGFFVDYQPTGGLGLLAIREGEPWSDALAMRGYDGNLYVVSATQKKLRVYPVQPSGYDGSASDYFTSPVPVDLSDPVSFVVDKNLFLLHRSGRIESFTDGTPNSFIGPPDDMMPRNPAGFAVSSDAVFVGDPARSRVIQLSRIGDFQRSLSLDDPGPLAHVRDLAVSDDGQALYVLSDQTIYRFVLSKT